MRGLALALLLATLGACTTTPTGRGQEPDPVADLTFRRWVEVGAERKACTLEFEFLWRGELEGSLGGRYRTQDNEVFIDALASRARGDSCAKRALQRLSDATRFHVEGQALLLDVASASPVRMRTGEPAPSLVGASVIGLPEGFARRVVESAGLVFEVRWRDGEELPHLADLRPDRITVHVNEGTVTSASVG